MKFIEHLTIKFDRPLQITCLLVGTALLIGYVAYPYLMDSIIETTTKEYRLNEQLPNDKVFIVSGTIQTGTYTTEINDGYGTWSVNASNINISMGNCIKAVVYKSIGELRVIKVLGDC